MTQNSSRAAGPRDPQLGIQMLDRISGKKIVCAQFSIPSAVPDAPPVNFKSAGRVLGRVSASLRQRRETSLYGNSRACLHRGQGAARWFPSPVESMSEALVNGDEVRIVSFGASNS